MASPSELPSITAALSADLSNAGIDHAISGATAMAAHGYVRATQDIDVLVVVPDIRLPEVFSIVRKRGFHGQDPDLVRALRDHHVAELRRGTLSVQILRPALPYHHVVLRRAVRLPVSGHAVPFVSREDLVVLKLLWHRTKDIADIQALLAAAGATLDVAYVRTTLGQLLPDGDPRHREFDGLATRFARPKKN